ncbi:MAG TPA: hypothetical protein VNO84_11715 [Burkholderiaceae bacterium]|nr:hypothetical protein [Burkholderiaceae bacterium]
MEPSDRSRQSRPANPEQQKQPQQQQPSESNGTQRQTQGARVKAPTDGGRLAGGGPQSKGGLRSDHSGSTNTLGDGITAGGQGNASKRDDLNR